MKNLSLYKINKRINSTLLPTAEQLIDIMGVALKNATSIDTPTFVIAVGAENIDAIWSANYAEYEGAYYWINDITQINNTHVELQCKKDSLATYKEYIKATKAYVVYSSSAGRTDIKDSRNVRTIHWNTPTKVIRGTPEMFEVSNDGGCFILQVANSDPSYKVSGASVYLMSPTQMQALMIDLYSTGDFVNSILKTYNNITPLILKCQWFPFSITHFQGVFEGSVEFVRIGGYEAGASGYRIANIKYPLCAEVFVIDTSEVIGNDYTYDESTCIAKLYLPFYGLVEMSPNILLKSNQRRITIRMTLDILSGALLYEILNQTSQISSYKNQIYRTQLGVDIPLASQGYNPLTFIGTAFTAVGSTATAGLAAGGEAAVASSLISLGNLMSSTSTLQKQTGIVGALGSRVDFGWSTEIEFHISRNELSESITAKKDVLGLPLCSTVELSTLSGYVQCANASVAAPAMESELREINNFLNGGVYLE